MTQKCRMKFQVGYREAVLQRKDEYTDDDTDDDDGS